MNKPNKNIEAIYELSPMQQGMLFHSIYSDEESNYFEQLTSTLAGNLNVDALKQAWENVLERHTILRTSFVYKKLDKMLQVVHKSVELPFNFEDWRNKKKEMQISDLNDFLTHDKEIGFNLSKAPLMRITIIQIETNKYELIWSYHHLLLDGWSLPIIFKDHII